MSCLWHVGCYEQCMHLCAYLLQFMINSFTHKKNKSMQALHVRSLKKNLVPRGVSIVLKSSSTVSAVAEGEQVSCRLSVSGEGLLFEQDQ